MFHHTRPSRRRLAAAACLVGAAGLVAGCSMAGMAAGSNDARAADPAAESAAAAPTSEPFYLPDPPQFKFGEFDAKDPEFEFFDPCKDIPEPIRARAGMAGPARTDIEMGIAIGNPVTECMWNDEVNGGYLGFQADIGDQDRLGEIGTVIDANPDSTIEGLVLHNIGNLSGTECLTSVNTTRGRWGIVADGDTGKTTRAEVCAKAIAAHELIIELLGETDGTQY